MVFDRVRNGMKLMALLIAGLLLAMGLSTCGGGGAGNPVSAVSISGGIEGYVYVPIGSAARIAASSSIPAAHKALNEAKVTLTCGSTSRTGMTNSDGYFSFANLPVGGCKIAISKEGFIEFETDISIEMNKMATIYGLTLISEDTHYCGNGVIEEGETCDDVMGNTDRPLCTIDNDETCEFCDTSCMSFATTVRISKNVFDIIDNEGQVEVIVGLKEEYIAPNEALTKEETIEQMKEFTKESQSSVLTNLNYCNIRDVDCSSRNDVDLKLDSQFWLINGFNGVLYESGLHKLIKDSDIKSIAYDMPLQLN